MCVCQEVGAELGFFVLFFSLIDSVTQSLKGSEEEQKKKKKTLSARFNPQREKSLQMVRITRQLLNHVYSFSLCGRGQGVGVCCLSTHYMYT